MLKSGTTLYTVGQLTASRACALPGLSKRGRRVLRDDLTEEEPHIKLSGVRLGFHDDRRRPFAHLMIARQIPSDSEYANRELWLKNPRGIYRSNEQPLKDAIYEIRDIAKGLQHEANVEGLLPPFDD